MSTAELASGTARLRILSFVTLSFTWFSPRTHAPANLRTRNGKVTTRGRRDTSRLLSYQKTELHIILTAAIFGRTRRDCCLNPVYNNEHYLSDTYKSKSSSYHFTPSQADYSTSANHTTSHTQCISPCSPLPLCWQDL
ncbi:hypothetical protein DEU56DRAFT_554960 [Suillus clintonianus]|uniref:uncharacterized protein n=1 Tax=Suillus clintonianus TaxID=1904413 RepID=UPI001B85C32C|nr:uncharacterized protein DEU56DRAFT_554960 [Suillus clintonianus]KAG2151523.1 hypothetical protein DEU56DRAFT_554960 [Suillus clintonianus]